MCYFFHWQFFVKNFALVYLKKSFRFFSERTLRERVPIFTVMVMKLGSQWLVSKWMVEAPFKEWHYFKTVLHIVLVIFKKGEIITCACFNLIYNLFLIMWIFFSPEVVNIIKNIICIFISFEKKMIFYVTQNFTKKKSKSPLCIVFT